MTRRTRILLGTAGVLVVAAVALFFFFRYQITRSFPQTDGPLRVSGLEGRVVVARDPFGVPRIEAGNEHDLLFATGYVHAQDRLWQMEIQRRAGEGRLSEVFGTPTIPFDRLFRVLGLRAVADSVERGMENASRLRLQWYADGVNAFISAHPGRLPIEFDLLRYAPEPWMPAHSILLGRVIAWQLNLSWWTDLTLGAVADRVGLRLAEDIMPGYPAGVAPTVAHVRPGAAAAGGCGFLETARAFRALLGGGAALGGSNAWAIAPARSATGAAMLANDAHLVLTLPGFWYEVRLSVPGFSARGMSIPGSPDIVAGRNDSIAWGITNLMADDADFYVERLNPADSGQYWYDGRWLPLRESREEIGVRGESSVSVSVRRTHHGPVVSDVHLPLSRYRPPHVVTMRWTGFETDDMLPAFHRISRARNWREFSSGVQLLAVPGQNFVYADVRGNIGYRCGARIPIRRGPSSTLPLPGWDPGAEWQGWVPPGEMPFLLNPPEGFVASANDRVAGGDYPYHISDLWEPPSRIQRLREVLGARGEVFSVQDQARLQNDRFSHFARELLPVIMQSLADTAGLSPDEALAREYFRNWNCVFATEDVATSVFQEWFVAMLRNTLRDEMGEDLFHDFLILGNVPVRVMTRLLTEGGDSPWFDNVATEAAESRNAVVRQSLREACAALRRRFGDDTRLWRWGDLHTVTLKHPFGLLSPLDRIFNVGPFPYGGGATTLLSGEYSYNEPFAVLVGASFRQIFDLSGLEPDRVVLPAGQSGQLFHPHYDDQTPLWLNGGYRLVRPWDEVTSRGGVLTLEPES